ncbi:MAG: glycosyltransferase [Acidobacteria bacterium]|nr:MAG: glycosyltransferase [Acidobacteriota bacterium]REK08749.1 MAG: glycosyltransferase [Acidobacteriota bacterium]
MAPLEQRAPNDRSQAPAVSVIVPFFDSAAHFADCLNALGRQEPVPGGHEVILVDNGGQDGSRAIAEELGREHGFTVVEERAPGAYAARNRGLEQARGELVAFTDADCRPDPDWLAQAVASMQDAAVGIAVGRCDYPESASPALRLLGRYENAKTRHVLAHRPTGYHFAYANNMVVRAQVFEQLGPFVSWRRAGDSELVHRMAARRPDLRTVYRDAQRVVHLEFLRARDRLRRLRLYTSTNARIDGFRELPAAVRVAILLRALLGR